jgi:hypothetical protein
MEYIRTLSREFEVGNSLELQIDNRSGAVSVRGEDTTKTRIEVVARLWAEDEDEADDQLELIARGIKHDGSRVTIKAPALLRDRPILFFGRGPRIEYQLVVPRKCRASITSRSGRVDVEDISGPIELIVRSGKAYAHRIDGDVRVESSSGGTQLEEVAGNVTVDARSGGIRVIGCKGTCTISARSGSLQVEDVAGDIDIETRSGSTTVADAGGAVKLRARSGAVRYDGAVRGLVDIDVWSGAIRMSVDRDSVFFLDAESAHGAVRSDLSVRSKSEPPPADAPTVRVRTRAGGIIIGYR